MYPLFLFFTASPAGVWLRSKLLALLVAVGLLAALWGLYHHEQRKLDALGQLKAVSALQAAKIVNLSEALNKLNASQEVSLQTLASLSAQKQQLSQRAEVRQSAVAARVASIAASGLPAEKKSEQTSTAYAQSLWQAYCEAQPILCTP